MLDNAENLKNILTDKCKTVILNWIFCAVYHFFNDMRKKYDYMFIYSPAYVSLFLIL